MSAVRWFLALVASGALCAPGLGATADMTADELAAAAFNAYNQARYPEAVAAIRQFESSFGGAEAGRKVMAGLRYPLAMSLLQQQKFADAAEVIETALQSSPPLPAEQREDLLFYRGVCRMQAGENDSARESFAAFAREFPQSRQTQEALLLLGTADLLAEKHAEAAAHFAAIKSRLDPANRGRATVLELYALLGAGRNDDALRLVLEEFPRIGEMPQIATFQTLALQLGATFLEAGELRKAIQCLQRVWERARLEKHQRARLAALEDALAAAEAQPKSDPHWKFQLKQLIAKIRRELATLAKIPNFDSALRLRLASAYQAMRRYREAALILEAMLAEMPPDPVVESGSVNLVQCWSQIERWPKAIEAAQAFAKKFPASKQLPLALYLQGVAQQRSGALDAAVATFDAIQTRFPQSDFAARALFMRGFTQLLAEKNTDALATFEDFARRHPRHDLADAAAYWRGMAFSLDRKPVETRAAMDAYLEAFPEGIHRGLAVYRRAHAAQAQRDYATSIRELSAYLEEFPGQESNSEALLLLGDAYFATGEIDAGIAAYRRIPPGDPRPFEEGWFKIGKAYQKMEDPARLRAHFEQFVREHPRSPRVAEAIFWIGKSYQQQGEPGRAREEYWKAFVELGNDPTIRSVDDLIPALILLHREDDARRQLAARLSDLREQTDADGRRTLAMRALWAYATAVAKSDPPLARRLLLQAAARADVPDTNPRLLADFAEALAAEGRRDDAEKMWRDLVKWNPRAPQKDRALLALAEIELARGNQAAALALYGRFEREVIGSTLAPRMLLARGRLLEQRGESKAALADYEALLADKVARGPDKAEALFRIAEIHLAAGRPRLAVPYYQRIYVMHRRWLDWVAPAYLRSGLAFEKLNDPTAARRTYQELLEDPQFAERPELPEARARLSALGGPLPSPTPTPNQG